MGDRGVRAAIMLGSVPIIVGVIYYVLNETRGTEHTFDLAGVTMLIAPGVAMIFGFMVILKGARDL